MKRYFHLAAGAAVRLRLFVLLFPVFLMTGCLFDTVDAPDYAVTDQGLPILNVPYVYQSPNLNGYFDETWKTAASIILPATRVDGQTVDVEIAAMYDEYHVYLAFRWKDYTESLNRLWVYKNGVWQKELLLDTGMRQWKSGTAQEDALAVFIPNRDARQSLTDDGRDCLKASSGSGRHDARLGYTRRGMLDVWLWQAERSNPVDQAEDAFVRSGAYLEPDAGTGGWIANGDFYPIYRHASPDRPDGRILLQADAAPAPPSWKTGLDVDEDTYVPTEVLVPREGSRADVRARGRWNEGRWTVMLERQLTLSNPDDVDINDLRHDQPVIIAVMDNAGFDGAMFTQPFVLRFEE